MQNKVLLIGSLGYIGSELKNFLDPFFQVDTCDRRGEGELTYNCDYNLIPTGDLEAYDNVILLAANPSILSCKDLGETFDNNVNKFVRLINKIPSETRFIYASSASVYGNNAGVLGESCEYHSVSTVPMNLYDLSKQSIDAYAKFSGKQYFGLRFGTLSGYSPNPRVDILLNSMVLSAKRDKEIWVSNPQSGKAVLGLKDLCRGVCAILTNAEPTPGLYNMSSFNCTVQSAADTVADTLQVPVRQVGGDKTYSHCLNTLKFEDEFNFEFLQEPEDLVQDILKIDFSTIIGREDEYKRL